MLLSIIIPAYNEEKLLPISLSLIQQALTESLIPDNAWEMIVCDNNSSDHTAAMAEKAGAKVITEEINQISRARNTGARLAQGDWFLFIDADTYPTTRLIQEVLDVIIRDPSYIGCGSTVTIKEDTTWNKLRMERLNPLMRLFNWCGGAFLLCERKAFLAIGGFSTDLFALEEIDFVLRLHRYGKKNGKKFRVLHRYPVVTSGRKGEISFSAFTSVFFSTTLSVLLLLAHWIFPRSWRIKGRSSWLNFWYKRRS